MDLTYKGSTVGAPLSTPNYDFKCLPDYVMTDIKGYHDSIYFTYINEIRCTKISDLKAKIANPDKKGIFINKGSSGFVFPANIQNYNLSCPVGSSFVNTTANSVQYIDNIVFACADYNNNIVSTTFPIIGISVADVNAKKQSNSCINSSDRFSGIYGKAGQTIDTFGVYCSEAGQPSAVQLAMRAQAQIVVDLAKNAVAAKNTTVNIATSAQLTLNTLASGSTTNNNTLYNQLLTSATQSNTSATQAKTFYDQAVAAAALVTTDSYAIERTKANVLIAKNASTDATTAATNTALYAVSGKSYIDAYVAVSLAEQAVVAKNAAVTATTEGGVALNSMAATPDSTTLQQLVIAKNVVAEEGLRATLNFEAQTRAAAASVDSTISGAVAVAAMAVESARAALVAAQETVRVSRSYIVNAQAFIDASAVVPIATAQGTNVTAFALQIELLTITVNNATTSAMMKAALDQAMENGRNMLNVVNRIGALIRQVDDLLATVQGDEVINFARNARATVVTTFEFASAAYDAAQALLSASREIYNNTVATEEAFRQSMVASGTSAMDTIVADAAKALQAARSVNDNAKQILIQIEFSATKSPEALVLLTQLDDNARVVNMAAATIEADILLAQQVQLDYKEFISFERVLNDMGSNARVARELAQDTSAMATRARELTMQKISSEKSMLESYKQIEQTATTTVLPQMRIQKEELLSKFAKAEAAFRSIQVLLRGATATRLHVSSATSVEISELLQTLVAAYDSVNLIYKDILFLYDSNVTFLNTVISSNLSFVVDRLFQQRALQTLQEISEIKNTAETSIATLETWVSNARKTLSDTIAAENAEAQRVATEKALAERLAAERLAAEKAKAESLRAEQISAEKETPTGPENRINTLSRPLPTERTIVDDMADDPKTKDKPKSVVDEKWFWPVVIVVPIVVIIALIVGIVVYRKQQSRKPY